MLRHVLPALLLGGLCAAVGAGCSAGASFDPKFGRNDTTDAQRTQLAALLRSLLAPFS